MSCIVFDVIQYKGISVTKIPLTERKQLLNEIITEDTSLVAKVKYFLVTELKTPFNAVFILDGSITLSDNEKKGLFSLIMSFLLAKALP